ncbi:MAG: 4-alpha-glucanotransferase [Candidatus Omnitrophica bacterium]|nr:4-alpha-glucanotransferase [Candidatus Omnitrophota bacterium]
MTKPPLKRRAGVLIALFAVHSKNSLGIGDFSDLKLITDWCKETGNSIIQLLPLNEVGQLFCPYDSVSSFAIEPAYLPIAPATAKDLRKSYPADSLFVNYQIKKEKLRLLKAEFNSLGSRNAQEINVFLSVNSYWLPDFALYKALKEHHDGKAWFDWEEKFKLRDKQALCDFSADFDAKIRFEIWLQWKLFRQLKDVREYAAKKGILLKGDLPILVSRDSADVWQHQEYFKLGFAAGAPPDMYCAKGQRWGMPTYSWDKIKADGYCYIKEKLKYAQNFYDIIRLDHAVGLFRIWSIPYNEPLENQGLNGFFDPQDESIWRAQGRELLQIMQGSTDMVLCAEDLGVIPQSCTDTLAEMGIPGNDVQRWVKDWRVRHDFLPPGEYRELSVATLSTHDTTNWKAWWQYEAGTIDEDLFIRKCNSKGIDFLEVKEKLFDPSRSCHGRLRWLDSVDSADKLAAILGRKKEEVADLLDLYLNSFQEKEKLCNLLGCAGAMNEVASPELLSRAIKLTMDSRSVFCIQSIRDLLSLADIFKGDPYQFRVNVPGTISEKNWSMRLPISFEDLLRHKINKQIRKMIEDSGRL